jgi:serine/threonine protein kinase
MPSCLPNIAAFLTVGNACLRACLPTYLTACLLLVYLFFFLIPAFPHAFLIGVFRNFILYTQISSSFSGEIKLCDFGESRLLDNSLASTHVGTVAYWPPERLLDTDSKYDIRTDIWSLGVTNMELIFGRLPYLPEISETNNTVDDNIEEQRSTPLSTIFILNCATTSMLDELIERDIRPRYSSELCEFLSSCLQKVDQRPKLDVLTKCLFYSNNNSDEKFNIAKEFISKVKVIVKNFTKDGPKKWLFYFWGPEIYFSKNEPSRGNFMRGIDYAHYQSMKMLP